jgi:hypothetical protein
MQWDEWRDNPISHIYDLKFMRHHLIFLFSLLLIPAGLLQAQLDHFAVLTTAGDTIIPAQTAGLTFFVEILAQDSMDNTDTTFNDTVMISSDGSLAAGGGTSAHFVNGVLSSTPVNIVNTGTFSITASYSPGSISGISKPFIVNAGSPAQLVFLQGPSSVRSGVSISPAITVQLRDSLNNPVPAAGENIQMAISSGSGKLTGTTTQSTNSSGIATFSDLKIDTAGIKQLTASASGVPTPATSASFPVTPGFASQITFVQAPSTGTAGVFFAPSPTIQMKDAAGNSVDTAGIGITLSVTSNDLLGTRVINTDNTGLVVFDSVYVTATGTRSFVAKNRFFPDASGPSVTVGPGAPAQIVITQEPGSAFAGQVLAPPLNAAVQDSFGNSETTSGIVISASLNGGGNLGGTTSQPTGTTGAVSFTNLTIDSSGSKTITLSATGLTPATTPAVSITSLEITANAGANGTVSQPGTVSILYGANRRYLITPATGYHVDTLRVDGTIVDSVAGYTFTNVTGNHTLSVSFAINTYSITATNGANGTMDPLAGTTVVNYGGNQTFTFTPSTGYHVDSLVVDGVLQTPAASYPFTNVTADHTLRVTFAINQYAVTATAGANGTITPSGTIAENYGTSPRFTFNPATGYHVDTVTVDGVKVDSVSGYTFVNIQASHTISVTFAVTKFTLTATGGTNGTVSPSGAVVVNYGVNQRFTFSPSPGYHVDTLLVDGVKVDSTVGYTFSNVTANHTLSVSFAINTYTITASNGTNGTINPPAGASVVNYGGSLTYTFTPSTGYHVDSLVVDGVVQAAAASYPFTNVTANHTLRVTFAIDQFTITASAGANGSISPSGSVSANYGTSPRFTFTPSTGYHVDSVIVDAVNIDSLTGYTFVNVTAGHTIRVTFAINQYTLTSSAGANGSIAPLGALPENFGSSQTYSITPNTGYHVDSLIIDGVNQAAALSYTFSAIAANHTIRVTFAPNSLTITITTRPDTLTYYADNVLYKGTHVFNWTAATLHTLATDTAQAGPSLNRWVWNSWSDTGAETHTVSPLVNTTYRALFTPQYYLTTSANPGGTVTPPTGWQDSGKAVVVTAVPNANYHWVAWSGSPALFVNPATITMTGPANETANFGKNPVTVTVQTLPDGRSFYLDGALYTVRQTRSMNPGEVHNVNANTPQPVSSGIQYALNAWSDSGLAVHSFTVPDTSITMTASYKLQYQLNVVATTGGTVQPASAFQDSGSVDSIRAIPNTGYHFSSWRGSGNGSYTGGVNPSAVTMRAPINDTAFFAIDTVLITASAGQHGAISPSGSVKVPYATNQTFTLVPDPGYHADSIIVDGVYNNGSSYTFFNVTVPHTIRATFRANNWTITATAGANGTISPSGVVGFSTGDNQTFTITPNLGYGVDSVIVDGVRVDSTTTYTFTNISASHTIRAVFLAGNLAVTIRTVPDSLQFRADGLLYTSPQTFAWVTGTSHAISLPDTQVVQTTTRWLWRSWSDGGAKTHTVVATRDTNFIANFRPQYYLTVTSDTTGSASPASSWRDSAAVVQLSATPNPGYKFVRWTGTGTVHPADTSNPGSVTMLAPVSEAASFGRFNAQVTIRSTPSGRQVLVDNIPVVTPQSYSWVTGSFHSVAAIDTQGGVAGFRYVWKSWSDSGTDVHSVIPLKDTTFTASFTTQCFITLEANPGGTVVPVSNWQDSGKVLTITANPDPGYHWVSWSGTPSLFSNPASFTVTSPTTEIANFALNPVLITVQTVPGGRSFFFDGGGPYTVKQTYTLVPGSVHNLNANSPQPVVAGEQFVWDNWSDGGTVTHSITIPDTSTTYTAYYHRQYLLTTAVRGGGTVSPTSGYLDSASVDSIRATPNTGYHFNGWKGSGNGSYTGPENPWVVTMLSAINDTATFSIDSLTISATAGPNGTISPIGAVNVAYGASPLFTITPNSGYHNDSLIVDGTFVGTGQSYQFFTVTRPHTIRVTFRANDFTITSSAGANGTILPLGAVGYSFGDSKTYNITPNGGYQVDSVIVDGVKTDSTTTYTFSNISSNHTIRATFAAGLIQVTIHTTPDALDFFADGTRYTAPKQFHWTTGTNHVLATADSQVVGGTSRYLWTGWSDGAAKSHTFIPLRDTVVTSSFRTQFQLTMASDTNGSVLPASSWQDSGKSVTITALPNAGYHFSSWVGIGTGSYTGTLNPDSVRMHGPITETASFSRYPANIIIRTSPDSLLVNVDDSVYQSPHMFVWTTGSQHTVAAVDTQAGRTGIRYLWSSWNDGGAESHGYTAVRDTTLICRFKTQYYLTMSSNPGGTVTPQSSWQDSGKSVLVTAIPNPGYHWTSWSGTPALATNPSTFTMTAPSNEIASFTKNAVQVTVQTIPDGRNFYFDGVFHSQRYTISVNPGETHTITAQTPQSIGGGSQYAWSTWSDGGPVTHTISVDTATTFTATFHLQYALSTAALPALGGTVTPPGVSYADSGSNVTVRAIPNQTYAFNGWKGDTSGIFNPISVLMDRPKADTALFVTGKRLTLTTNPPGRQVMVDDSVLTTPVSVYLVQGSTHTLAAPSPQAGATGIQYVWKSWSDSGAVSHPLTITADTAISALFSTQVFLTMLSGTGGHVTPASGWINQNDSVTIRSFPDAGFAFVDWTGHGTGSYSGSIDSVIIRMSSPISETAAFGHVLPPPVLSGVPDNASGVSTTPVLGWNAYTSATSYSLQVSTDSLFRNLAAVNLDTALDGGVTSFQMPPLANLMTYYWRMKVHVGADVSTYSVFRRFTTLNAQIIIVTPPVGWATRFTYPLRWSTVDLSGGVAVRMSINGGSSYQTLASSIPNSGSFNVHIPDGTLYISNFCKIRIESLLNPAIYSESGTFSIVSGVLAPTTPVTISLNFPASPGSSTDYRLFAAPGLADTIHFSSFLSGEQKIDWRAFADNGATNNFLVEITPSSHMTTGVGYWLLKKNNLSVPGYSAVLPPLDTLGATYAIPLHDGWNIIGNPFDKAIPWDAVLTVNNLSASSVANGYNGSFFASTSVDKCTGYYFFNDGSLSALLMPYPFGSGGAHYLTVPQADWKLQLSLETDINTDPENYIGIAPAVKSGRNILNTHKPPLFLDQGFLYFDRPDLDARYSRFSSDYRTALGDGQVWSFTVSNPRKTHQSLHIRGLDQVPPEMSVVLMNMLNSDPVDLRKNPDYAFDAVGSSMPFRLIVGTPEFVRQQVRATRPAAFELAQNYPNPFNGTTAIRVSLPQDSRVRLEIYSILGERVATVADGFFGAGVHTFQWNGANSAGTTVATGVYFCRFSDGANLVMSKKMIFAK